MAIILHIDTAIDAASVCLAKDDQILGFEQNLVQKEHSSWLHPTIKRIFSDSGVDIRETEAIAVTIGPGSYTGLRVGLSAAKGLCFTLDIPLITIGTLELIADLVSPAEADFICPVIDARRMEIFTAVYAPDKKLIRPPAARILDELTFDDLFKRGRVLFAGNAVGKMRGLYADRNADWNDQMPNARAMPDIATGKFRDGDFSDLAYTDPFYVKEFYHSAQ